MPIIGVITNPNSRKNRGRPGRADRLARIVGDLGVVRQTTTTAEIGPALDEMRAHGVRYWVTDGGDGSLHWLLNTAAERYGGTASLPGTLRYALPTNGGTIDYVARYAGVRGQAEEILGTLVRQEAEGRRVPVARVPSLLLRGTRVGPDGAERTFERVGFAAAVAGIGSGFFDQYYRIPQGGPRAILEVIAKGAGSFLLDRTPLVRGAVPPAWLDYGRVALGHVRARVTVDGQELPYRELSAFHVGAFPINLGGVVKVFQWAGEGRLHCMVGEISPTAMIANLPRLFTGRRIKSRQLFDAPAQRIHAVVEGERLFRPVVDGEMIEGVRELTLEPGPHFAIPSIDAKARR